MNDDLTPIYHAVTVSDDEAGKRLDAWLASHIPSLSRERIKRLMLNGQCVLGDEGVANPICITDTSRRVKAGECYRITEPPATPMTMEAQEVDFTVVYEDDDMLVLNKPAGLTVHPAAGNPDQTLVNGLLAHCGSTLSGIGGVQRPGIVHRLDKDTSGLMVVAKHDAAHQALSEQLQDRSLSRIYTALVWGVPTPRNGTITGAIGRSSRHRKKMAVVKVGGKEATTHYRVLESYLDGLFSLVECRLETGRTHQIRVHMTEKGFPLLGDPLYGNASRKLPKRLDDEVQEGIRTLKRQALHAAEIGFIHPSTLENMRFSVELPEDFRYILSLIQEKP